MCHSPLQNRVLPNGDIVALETRGTLMGNRGGQIHDPETRTLGNRRWASRRWICCGLNFKGRQREVMGKGYTELFFLDEVTALAAGHRPCFECRREAAKSYIDAVRNSGTSKQPLKVDALDAQLHAERLATRPRLARKDLQTLPDGTMIESDGKAYAVLGNRLVPWLPRGYGTEQISREGNIFKDEITLLTPQTSVRALAAGYRPEWHETAKIS